MARLCAVIACVACASTARADEWALAPVRTWGSVAYDLRAERVEDQPDRLQQLFTTTLNMSSYLYEPWFAVTSGGIGVTFSDLDETRTGGRDRFLTGNARLNLFPRSRFPFEAHFDATDSRIGATDESLSDYRSREFGLVQRYRPLDSNVQFTASHDRRSQDGVRSGRYEQQITQLEFSDSIGKHNLSVSGSLSDSRRVDTDENLRYDTLVARHSYAPSSRLSVDTVANWADTAAQVAAIDNANRFLQVNTLAFWRAASRPMTVSASARLFDFESSRGEGLLASSQQVAATLGATYLYGPEWRFNGGGNFARTRTTAGDASAGAATLGASWQGAPVTRGRLDYDRYGSADLSANYGDDPRLASAGREPVDPFVAAIQAGHAVSWTHTGASRSRFVVSLGQSATWQSGTSANAFSAAGPEATHTAALTWSDGDATASSYVRFSFGDTRSLGGRASRELQLMNLQATRLVSIDADASWSGSLTVQSSRQRNTFEALVPSSRGFRTMLSADLTYQRDRLFGVRQLRYSSLLRVSEQRELQLYPDPRDRESHSWENRLDWRAGKLSTRIALRAARVDQQMRYLATFKVTREIGN